MDDTASSCKKLRPLNPEYGVRWRVLANKRNWSASVFCKTLENYTYADLESIIANFEYNMWQQHQALAFHGHQAENFTDGMMALSVSVHDVTPLAKTGDLCFLRHDGVVTMTLRDATRIHYSNVAMVVVPHGKKPQLWKTPTTNNGTLLISGQPRCVDMYEALDEYFNAMEQPEVLFCPLRDRLTHAQEFAIVKYIEHFKHGDDDVQRACYSGEMIARLFRQLDMFPENIDCKSVLPAHFLLESPMLPSFAEPPKNCNDKPAPLYGEDWCKFFNKWQHPPYYFTDGQSWRNLVTIATVMDRV